MTLASNLPYLPLNPVKLSLPNKSLSHVHDIFFILYPTEFKQGYLRDCGFEVAHWRLLGSPVDA